MTAPEPGPQPYVIWSFEHDAWWRPGRMGYTPVFAEAGHYDAAEAQHIVLNANRYAKDVHEQALPLDVAKTYEALGWHRLAPGAYDDQDGGLHLVVSEMLAGYGYPDTPENRATLIKAAHVVAGDRPIVSVLD